MIRRLFIVIGLFVVADLSPAAFAQGDALEIEGFQRSNNYIRLTMDSDTSYYHQVWFTDSLTNSVWSVTGLVSGSVWSNSLGSNNFFYRVISVPISSPDDEDDDFLPDTWELEFGLDGLDDSDGGEDSDYDGFNNREEYASGTDPIIPYSAPTNAVYVDDDGSFTGTGSFIDPFPYISWGIDAAVSGYRVVVMPGVYDTPGDRNLEIDGKAIQVRSVGGAGLTIIDCKSLGQGFVIEDESINSTIEGFTIKNAINGGIYASNASPNVTDCIIKDNDGLGAVLFDSSSDFENCVFLNNASGGVAIAKGSDVSLENCTFFGNETNAVFCDVSSVVEIENCIVWSNGLDLRDVGDELVQDADLDTEAGEPDSPWTEAYGEEAYRYGFYYVRTGEWCTIVQPLGLESNQTYRLIMDVDGRSYNRLDVWLDGTRVAAPRDITSAETNTFTLTANSEELRVTFLADGGSDERNGVLSLYGISIRQLRTTNEQCTLSSNYTNDPQFIYDQYHLQNSSACIDAGATNSISNDVDQDQRETIDIGADEFADADSDGLPDWWEDEYGNLDAAADSDGDGLTNLEEFQHGTNPAAEDTEGDEINDGDEVHVYETDPLSEDTDDDGANDNLEITGGTDPNVDGGDDDGDGVSNHLEFLQSSSMTNGDSDGDGVGDGSDPSPMTANCFINVTVTNQIDEVPSTEINPGTGNADFYANIIFNPTAPTNSAGVQQVVIQGTVDDAFVINGRGEYCWQIKGCYLDPWEYDITDDITDMTHGSFEIDVYDWIDAGWLSNHVAFSATAEITYRIAVSEQVDITGEDALCVGEPKTLSATGGTPPLTWQSSDSSVATVDANGLVTGVGTGVVTITAFDTNACTDSIEVSVYQIKVELSEANPCKLATVDIGVGAESFLPPNETIEWTMTIDGSNTWELGYPLMGYELDEYFELTNPGMNTNGGSVVIGSSGLLEGKTVEITATMESLGCVGSTSFVIQCHSCEDALISWQTNFAIATNMAVQIETTSKQIIRTRSLFLFNLRQSGMSLCIKAFTSPGSPGTCAENAATCLGMIYEKASEIVRGDPWDSNVSNAVANMEALNTDFSNLSEQLDTLETQYTNQVNLVEQLEDDVYDCLYETDDTCYCQSTIDKLLQIFNREYWLYGSTAALPEPQSLEEITVICTAFGCIVVGE